MANGKKQKPIEVIASIIEESLRDLPKEEQLARLTLASADATRALSGTRLPSRKTREAHRASWQIRSAMKVGE